MCGEHFRISKEYISGKIVTNPRALQSIINNKSLFVVAFASHGRHIPGNLHFCWNTTTWERGSGGYGRKRVLPRNLWQGSIIGDKFWNLEEEELAVIMGSKFGEVMGGEFEIESVTPRNQIKNFRPVCLLLPPPRSPSSQTRRLCSSIFIPPSFRAGKLVLLDFYSVGKKLVESLFYFPLLLPWGLFSLDRESPFFC